MEHRIEPFFSFVNGGENMTNAENTPKKKRYVARVVLILVLGCIGAFILLDLIWYPGTTDFYSLMDLKRGEICEVRFQRYGKIASIRQEKKLQDTLDIFDCDVEKQGPVIHCGCTTGGGRLVIFIRKDGSEARLLLDTSDVYSSYMPRFQTGPYYYSFTKRIDGTFLDAFLAEEEWQSVYLYDSEYE